MAKKLKISIRHCIECGARNQFEGRETICNACYMKAEAIQVAEVAAKAAKWAATHKCRGCKTGLPLHLYFQCEACLPPFERSTDQGEDMERESSFTYWTDETPSCKTELVSG